MKKFAIISIVSVFLILVPSCSKKDQAQERSGIAAEIKLLIKDKNFEAARLMAIDTLDPQLRSLYYEADENLGHASHLDVRCNERIEEILYEIVKKVPASNVRFNRDIYAQLNTLYPENELYKKKFIYYDRKQRGVIKY
jgi:competence protein ComGC